MSEFNWHMSRRKEKLPEYIGETLDRICKEEGGHGFDQVWDGTAYVCTFSGPNRGDPFDEQLAERVLRTVKKYAVLATSEKHALLLEQFLKLA